MSMSTGKEETIMYAALKRIYANTKNATYLTNAVKKGWITEAEKEQIIASAE